MYSENWVRLCGEIKDYVGNICNQAIKDNKKIIIWGYGRCGKFFKHLIEDIDKRCKVDYIIDDDLTRLCNGKVYVYRQSLLDYIDTDKFIILAALKDIKSIEDSLDFHGFVINSNLYDVRKDIGESYLEFFEKRYKDVDFSITLREDCDEYNSMCNRHEAFGHASTDRVFEAITKLDDNLHFFDFGSGKGGALCYAYMHVIKHIGGVELVKHIYEHSVKNVEKLGIECEIFNENALDVNIDEYNCFFFFNPFRGKLFGAVMQNIRNSYEKKHRKIYVIYANPFEHKQVIQAGFKLIEQVPVDCIDPLLNIYSII